MLCDLQSDSTVSYNKLRAIPVQVCASRGQAEVYRSQFKMLRRQKGESLTDHAQDIRRLMAMAFPGPADSTTDMVTRDVFIEALADQDVVIQIQVQRPADLNSAVQVAHQMKAVMKSLTRKSCKPVRAVVQGTRNPRVEAELRDLKAGQKHLLDVVRQFGRPENEHNDGISARWERSLAVAADRTEYRQAGSRYRGSSRNREEKRVFLLRARRKFC